jgi:hypothetical protein
MESCWELKSGGLDLIDQVVTSGHDLYIHMAIRFYIAIVHSTLLKLL